MSQQLSYTASRLVAHRRRSHAVRIGEVAVGGGNPVVVQSMTTTPTQDVKATVDQAIRLAEAGCQIVRIEGHPS
jgi:(E)-4-hydroxy-3-methylbut-2-enyl-diphosphate synthase